MSRKDIIIATLILAFLTMNVGLSGQGKSGILTASTVAQSSVAFPCSIPGTADLCRFAVLFFLLSRPQAANSSWPNEFLGTGQALTAAGES